MKTMAHWAGLILVGLSGGRPPAGLVIAAEGWLTVVIMFVVIFLIVISFAVSEKLKKYYLIFFVLYLAFLTKMLGFIWNRFIWSLAPSQTFGWWAISGIVLVILIILGFVAGCKLIAYYYAQREGPAEGVR